MNVHELGAVKTRDPKKVAQHAGFLGANMLVAVTELVRASVAAMLVFRECGVLIGLLLVDRLVG